MQMKDIQSYLDWRKDTSKPHPWFEKHVKPENEKRKEDKREA